MKNKLIITSTPKGYCGSVRQMVFDWHKLILKEKRKEKINKLNEISK